ncbi:RNA methyltransferase, TrmH family [Spiroplasma corruscae]|uniref:RNA methyltransferase, TrmH family n=1 Tax=Spiroplasma corruscae TaxID=216934 RepID=A0A222END1_9MOLU|nr:RNA methyltransferase [Spiroplasma corruscae]ASP28000.1 RNA methyltransferase, TrmH family [Spiroplasma corruscae]
MKVIDSISNNLIKHIIDLKNTSYQKEQGKYLIEGEKMVKLAYDLNKVEYILVTEKYNYEHFKHENNLIIISEKVSKKITSLKNHQGYFAVCNIDTANFNDNSNYLLLDDIQDPGNMGTLLRSACAFGFLNVVASENTVSFYNDKVLRATMSNHFLLNLHVVCDLENFIKEIKNDDIEIIGSYLGDEIVSNHLRIKTKNKVALILGNEGKGINKQLIKYFDNNIIIKMDNGVDSLNVGVAGSILMKDIYYQKSE